MRKYLSFDPSKGYPAGENVYYECSLCGNILPSRPEENLACSCFNVVIDIEAGRLSVKDHKNFKAFIDDSDQQEL